MIKKCKEQSSSIIEIKQVPLDEWNELEKTIETSEHTCILFWAQDRQDIRLLFYSNDKSIRPLEFMDYLVQEYVLIQGGTQTAQATLTPILLQAMMSDFEADTVQTLLEKIKEDYFVKCNWIYAAEYAKEQKELILQMPKYKKKKITWAFVKTTDIVEKGKTFYLKSLENESDMQLEASDDLYVMIGTRGEIYHMKRERFEDTY